MNNKFTIQQFEYKPLSQYAYAILSGKQIILIDPARNPQPYYDFAKKHNAKIIGVIETHPHADFVSSHLEIHENNGAAIYVSKFVGAEYPHVNFDEGDRIVFGDVVLKAINTPGHSPDSISVILESNGKDKAIFSGDTLFVGDCGRPDLRENSGNKKAERKELAKKMYNSLRKKLLVLEDKIIVYPAHGAGTLCGKSLGNASNSTIGIESLNNWSLQEMSEESFLKELLTDQPFIPKYFGFNVELNKKGAGIFAKNISGVPRMKKITCENYTSILDKNTLIIDTRPSQQFQKYRFKNSINLMDDGRFETWLGSIVSPNEQFYLTAENEMRLEQIIERIANIGYETKIKGAFIGSFCPVDFKFLDLENFKQNQNAYTILDIRNTPEIVQKQIFSGSIKIPLSELRERFSEIPTDKPIVVHCAGGYRSAAGSSILKNTMTDSIVYDLGEAITEFGG